MAQVVYYVVATERCAGRSTFCVPTRQLRQRVLRLDRQADGRADRPVRRRLQHQRHPHPVLQRQRHEHRAGRADAQPVHGHPGVVELRAAAVRDERSRRGDDRRAAAAVPRHGPAAGRGRPARQFLDGLFRAGAARRRRDARRDRATFRDDGHARRPAHRRRRRRRRAPARPPGRRRSSRSPPPTRRSSPTRSRRRPACARRCRRTSPTCSSAPNGSSAPRQRPRRRRALRRQRRSSRLATRARRALPPARPQVVVPARCVVSSRAVLYSGGARASRAAPLQPVPTFGC